LWISDLIFDNEKYCHQDYLWTKYFVACKLVIKLHLHRVATAPFDAHHLVAVAIVHVVTIAIACPPPLLPLPSLPLPLPMPLPFDSSVKEVGNGNSR
jgi:hypothetical protein